MKHRFTIELEIDDNVFVTPRVGIEGDLETDDFAIPLLRGVVEVLVLLRDIRGTEEVEKALRRLK
jgi:hypothetical protein